MNDLHVSLDGYRIVPLSKDIDRSGFTCGSEPLIDEWIKQKARQAHEARLSRTYCLLTVPSQQCIGFYSLRPITVLLENLPERVAGGFKRGEAPALLLAMMGIDRTMQGKGLGRELLLDAMLITLQASWRTGGVVMVTDAMNAVAWAMYRKAGFRSLSADAAATLFNGPERLYLPIHHIEAWWEERAAQQGAAEGGRG